MGPLFCYEKRFDKQSNINKMAVSFLAHPQKTKRNMEVLDASDDC